MTVSARPRRSIALVACLVVLTALGVTGITVFSSANTPRANWRFGPKQELLEPFDRAPMFDAMSLDLTLPHKAYVYTVYYSHTHGCRALFPSDYLATDMKNPLPQGRHRLPGTWKKKDLQWFIPNCKNEAVNLITVVSRKPLTDLHKSMKTMFQIGNTAFPDMSFGSYMPKGGKEVLPKRSRIPHPLLEQAANSVDAALPGPMLELDNHPGVFVKVMSVVPNDKRPGTKPPTSPYLQQLNNLEQKMRKGEDPQQASKPGK